MACQRTLIKAACKFLSYYFMVVMGGNTIRHNYRQANISSISCTVGHLTTFCNRHPHEPLFRDARLVVYLFCKLGCFFHNAEGMAAVIVDFQYAKHAEAPRQRDVIETVKGAQLTIDLRCNSSERCLHPNQREKNSKEVDSKLSVRISGGARVLRHVATMQGNVHEHASRAFL